MKKTTLTKLSIACIIISVLFNIILLGCDVIKGTYTANGEDGECSISFDEYTYMKISESDGQITATDYGFYQYFRRNTVANTTEDDEDLLVLESAKSGRSQSLTRTTVFSLKYHDYYYDDDGVDIVYYCRGAIFLQVIFLLIDVAASVAIVVINRKEKVRTP